MSEIKKEELISIIEDKFVYSTSDDKEHIISTSKRLDVDIINGIELYNSSSTKHMAVPLGQPKTAIIVNDRIICPLLSGGKRIISSKAQFNDQFSENSIYFEGQEGILLYIWKDYNGKCHMSSMSKIDIIGSNSRFKPESETIDNMYKNLKGPLPEDFFDPSFRLSPYVHILFMVHKDFFFISTEDPGDGYIMYVGTKKWYTPEPGAEDVEISPKSMELVEFVEEAIRFNKIAKLPVLTKEQSAATLTNRETIDGGFIICLNSVSDESYTFTQLYTPTYYMRKKIRGGHANITYSLFGFLGYARDRYVTNDYPTFSMDRFRYIMSRLEQERIKDGRFRRFTNDELAKSPFVRSLHLFLYFAYASADCHLKEAYDAISYYFSARNGLSKDLNYVIENRLERAMMQNKKFNTLKLDWQSLINAYYVERRKRIKQYINNLDGKQLYRLFRDLPPWLQRCPKNADLAITTQYKDL